MMERVRVELDTFLATVRPEPSQRQHMDISYQLNETAFVLHVHKRAENAGMLTPHACLKAVHSEDPEGWLLYVPDSDGHWVAYQELVYATELADVLLAAKALLPESEAPGQMDLAC